MSDDVVKSAVLECNDNPYNNVQHIEVINNNPTQEDIKSLQSEKYNLLEKIGKQQNAENYSHYDEALKYLVPQKELSDGDVISTKDGKITYAELVEVTKSVENVSKKDAEFDKMPKVFLYSQAPDGIVGDIAKAIRTEDGISEMSYIAKKDSVLINQDFLNSHSKEEVLAIFAHEYGHKIANATLGEAAAQSPTKYAEQRREGEYIGDAYAGLSGHGKGLVSYLDSQEKSLSQEPLDKHPVNSQRIEMINGIEANSSSSKAVFETMLGGFKAQQRFMVCETSNDHKVPLSTGETPAWVKQIQQLH